VDGVAGDRKGNRIAERAGDAAISERLIDGGAATSPRAVTASTAVRRSVFMFFISLPFIRWLA